LLWSNSESSLQQLHHQQALNTGVSYDPTVGLRGPACLWPAAAFGLLSQPGHRPSWRMAHSHRAACRDEASGPKHSPVLEKSFSFSFMIK
jgi:hypothetical protein